MSGSRGKSEIPDELIERRAGIFAVDYSRAYPAPSTPGQRRWFRRGWECRHDAEWRPGLIWRDRKQSHPAAQEAVAFVVGVASGALALWFALGH